MGNQVDFYQQYKSWYQKRHDDWWQQAKQHEIWLWHAPTLSSLAVVGLQASIQQLQDIQRQAKVHLCEKLTNLDFSAQCHCGFDGFKATLSNHLEPFEQQKNEMQQQLVAFFRQAGIREQIQQAYHEDVLNTPSIRDYLNEKTTVPEIKDSVLFEKLLASVAPVKSINCRTYFVGKNMGATRFIGNLNEAISTTKLTVTIFCNKP